MTGSRFTTWNSRLARSEPMTRTPVKPRFPLLPPAPEKAGRAENRTAPKGTGGMGQRKSARARAEGHFSGETRLLVRLRAGSGDIFEARCEACGRWLGAEDGDYQHRASRGSGGCRDSVISGCANCALMCRPCHEKAERRDPHMGMDAAGFWIEHGTTPEYDPRNVAIMLCGAQPGARVYLAEDGIGPDGDGYLRRRPGLGVAA